VASGHERLIEDLRPGLDRWLGAHGDLVPGAGAVPGAGLRVHSLSHATAGLANETVLVDLGPGHPGIVLRLPPLEPSFPVYDLTTQARVQSAVAGAGIPAPAPAVVETDTAWIGSPFLVMPRVSGQIPGPAPVFDQWLMGLAVDAQRRLHDGMIDTLVALHAMDWKGGAVGRELASSLPGPTLKDALDYWSDYVTWAGDGSPLPALVDGLVWCRQRTPSGSGAGAGTGADASPPVLLWGDARLGNLVFDRDLAVHAVLDWELAAFGPREMDLGWYLGLDAMMDDLFGQRVPGFPSRADAVARYEAASGHAVMDLEWHEIFALIRALAINDRQQRVAAASGQSYLAGTRPARTSRAPREDPLVGVLRARMEAADK
jgi:aminoglycoside phosphotransferase (APT) family kinase protein